MLPLSIILLASYLSNPAYSVAKLEGITIKGLPPVNGHIHVDQFGYLPDETKVAVISDPIKGYNAGDVFKPGFRYELRERQSGKVVFSGILKVWSQGKVHEDSGDRGWWFDFTSVKGPGEYYVYDKGNECRSPVVRIGPEVFNPVLKAVSRVFYYQRLGVPHEAKFAGDEWVSDAEFLQDKHARAVWAKNDSSLERDLAGGWMDAGDTDKYPPFNGEVIHPLLYAFSANPSAFGDANNIPESGNGLPDLLDEIKYQLDWLKKMQFSDGAVPVKMGNVDFNEAWPLSTDTRPRYYGPKDSGAAIYTAAIFAHAARVYSKFPAWTAFAEDLKQRALKGWSWFHSHPRTFNTDTGEIKSGIANRSNDEQDRMEVFAAIHLFALTGDSKYNQVVVSKAASTRQLNEYTWSAYETGVGESLSDYASLPGADAGLKAKIREQLRRSASDDHWAPAPEADLYRSYMVPSSYHWGSNMVKAAFGVAALIGSHQPGIDAATEARLRQRAADILHGFDGVNPFAATMLTNMKPYGAENSLMSIYHERYKFGTKWGYNPPPGYLVGGPNQSITGKSENGQPSIEWLKGQPRAKAYADTGKGWPESSWEFSEPAIYYQAMYLRLLAEFAKQLF